jgi:two-component system, OmpR family, alkaline phosphatase synthesis response regulator PhoP
MLKNIRAGNVVQLRSACNIRPPHRGCAVNQPVVPQHCQGPGKRPTSDQVKEPGTTRIPNEKPPFGQVARTHRQTQEKVSAAVVMKSHVTQIARASAEPDAEIFFDESLFPITSGALKEIRGLESFLPVIVLVPRSTVADQVALRKNPLAKLPSKPSETKKLLGVLGKAVRHLKSNYGESTFAFGDVTVNFSAMEAVRDGEPVMLTAMEFKTLKYLVQNAGRVISREELLNEVWGYENYPCTRTVDNHILRLRQKLERDPSRPAHFRTMHRSGYKFLP